MKSYNTIAYGGGYETAAAVHLPVFRSCQRLLRRLFPAFRCLNVVVVISAAVMGFVTAHDPQEDKSHVYRYASAVPEQWLSAQPDVDITPVALKAQRHGVP